MIGDKIVARISFILIMAVLSLFIFQDVQGLEIYTDSNECINVELGQEFAIALDSNPVGGYRWQIAKPLDQSMICAVSSEYEPKNAESKDLKGKEMFFFKAVGKGMTMISLKYARCNERDMYPLESKTFIVNVR